MENGPFEDVFHTENCNSPLLCNLVYQSVSLFLPSPPKILTPPNPSNPTEAAKKKYAKALEYLSRAIAVAPNYARGPAKV